MLTANHYGFPYATNLADWILSIAFIVAVFSAGACATQLLQVSMQAVSYIRRKLKWRRTEKRRIEWLRNLPKQEYDVMVYFFSNNLQAFSASSDEPKIQALLQKGLIERRTGEHYLESWPFVIPDFVWKEMDSSGNFKVGYADKLPHPFEYI